MGTAGYSNAKMIGSNSIQRKEKKMGFFKRWLYNQITECQPNNMLVDSPIRVSNSIDQPERALQFTVYNANGGRVIETRRYDRQKDRHNQNLYIITNDQDFGREIDKIITMEALR